MVKNYILRQCDVIALCDYIVPEYDGNMFLFVNKTERGRYSAVTIDGKRYPFPVDAISLIRTLEGWWLVTATHCQLEDFEQYGDASYDMEPVCREFNPILDFLLSENP